MQQRKSASSLSGRPSGTDGSDFSYRMVVDSRYTKVARGKSLLKALILVKAAFLLIGVLSIFLLTSDKGSPDVLAISSIAIGFISLIVGELGRRWSRVSSLKFYMVASSIAILLSIACVVKSNFMLEVIQDPSKWEANKFELIETFRVVAGFLVQIYTIHTVISLIGNMSPPKRAS